MVKMNSTTKTESRWSHSSQRDLGRVRITACKITGTEEKQAISRWDSDDAQVVAIQHCTKHLKFVVCFAQLSSKENWYVPPQGWIGHNGNTVFPQENWSFPKNQIAPSPFLTLNFVLNFCDENYKAKLWSDHSFLIKHFTLLTWAAAISFSGSIR